MSECRQGKRNNGDVVWRRPNYATIHRIIANPIYGGAYAYGKSGAAAGYGSPSIRPGARRKPRKEWLALIPGSHEGYVSWERAEAIRTMVSDNVPTGPHHGAPKQGDALLARLVRCRRCGRKLTVRYTGIAAGQVDDVVCQLLLVVPTSGNAPLRGAMLT